MVPTRGLIAVLAAFAASGCSLSPGGSSSVTVPIPRSLRAHALAVTAPAPVPAPATLAGIPTGGATLNATSLSDFNCFAIQVKGGGIPSDPAISCPAGDGNVTLISGFVPSSISQIDLQVPRGPSRTFQLLAMRSPTGQCPDLRQLVSSRASGDPSYDSFGSVYLVGLGTADVFEDTSVEIRASYDANKPSTVFDGCVALNPKGTWAMTGQVHASGRRTSAVTRLADGEFLISGGGYSSSTQSTTAEIFHPNNVAAAVLSTSLQLPRSYHTSTLLGDGTVLLVGGMVPGTNTVQYLPEIFDPSGETFTVIDSPMTIPRYAHTATRLRDGRLFIAGGGNYDSTLAKMVLRPETEVFDPATRHFSPMPPLTNLRRDHQAVSLQDGRVLLVGGWDHISTGAPVAAAEIFDPGSNSISPAGSLAVARDHFTATLLSDGRVLIAGGDVLGGVTASVEIFDPTTSTFTSLPLLNRVRSWHSAVLLPRDRVMIVGGQDGANGILVSEIYDPATGVSTDAMTLANARLGGIAEIQNGTLYFFGGWDPAVQSADHDVLSIDYYQ